MVDAGKLESAFDLVSRLHSEKSYDIAIRLADRHYKLADEVEKLKIYKFPDEDDESVGNSQTSNNFFDHSEGSESKQISPDSRQIQKRNIMLSEPVGSVNKKHRLN